jgi:endonuclease/exonuclease/phosphatase family metal-dependent hydrolase
MKLISLNTWMGIAGEPLLEFVRSHAEKTDMFCFQEVLNGGEAEGIELWGTKEKREHNLLAVLTELLPEHRPFFHPNKGAWAGLVTFVRKDIRVLENGNLFVHGSGPHKKTDMKSSARNIQHVTFETECKKITVINFHGLWNGGGHGDVPDRLAQSERIVGYLNSLSNAHIMCGDFNLLPHTKSLAMLENTGMHNLIKEYGITTTRTKLYTRTPDKFADYTLVSKGIEVKDFKVLPDEVSDHSPMYLEFE